MQNWNLIGMKPTAKSKGRYICLEMKNKGVLCNFKVRTVVVVINLKKSDWCPQISKGFVPWLDGFDTLIKFLSIYLSIVSNKEKGTLFKQLIFFVYKAERM